MTEDLNPIQQQEQEQQHSSDISTALSDFVSVYHRCFNDVQAAIPCVRNFFQPVFEPLKHKILQQQQQQQQQQELELEQRDDDQNKDKSSSTTTTTTTTTAGHANLLEEIEANFVKLHRQITSLATSIRKDIDANTPDERCVAVAVLGSALLLSEN